MDNDEKRRIREEFKKELDIVKEEYKEEIDKVEKMKEEYKKDIDESIKRQEELKEELKEEVKNRKCLNILLKCIYVYLYIENKCLLIYSKIKNNIFFIFLLLCSLLFLCFFSANKDIQDNSQLNTKNKEIIAMKEEPNKDEAKKEDKQINEDKAKKEDKQINKDEYTIIKTSFNKDNIINGLKICVTGKIEQINKEANDYNELIISLEKSDGLIFYGVVDKNKMQLKEGDYVSVYGTLSNVRVQYPIISNLIEKVDK